MALNKDDEWQRGMRDRYLLQFYKKYSQRFIFIDGDEETCALKVQKAFGIDTWLQSIYTGEALGVEEKFDRFPSEQRKNFALETKSCTVQGRLKDGWMVYSEADLLFYAFQLANKRGVDLFILRFQPLKRWFWQFFHPHHPQRAYVMPNTLNHSEIYRVPIASITSLKEVRPQRYLITDDGIRSLHLLAQPFNLMKTQEMLRRERETAELHKQVEQIAGMYATQQADDEWLEETGEA